MRVAFSLPTLLGFLPGSGSPILGGPNAVNSAADTLGFGERDGYLLGAASAQVFYQLIGHIGPSYGTVPAGLEVVVPFISCAQGARSVLSRPIYDAVSYCIVVGIGGAPSVNGALCLALLMGRNGREATFHPIRTGSIPSTGSCTSGTVSELRVCFRFNR